MNPPASSSTRSLDAQPWQSMATYTGRTSQHRQQFSTNSTIKFQGRQTNLYPSDLELDDPQKRLDHRPLHQDGYIPCPYQPQSHLPPYQLIPVCRQILTKKNLLVLPNQIATVALLNGYADLYLSDSNDTPVF